MQFILRLTKQHDLSYIVKMKGTTDNKLVDLSKDIWKYLLLKQIAVTAERYLNTRVDWQSLLQKIP